MPVRIRLSRRGAKKKPFYRIVVADGRRSRDGKFIDLVGTYNPMLSKDNPERVKIDVEKVKEWIQKGAQPSERVKLFLSNLGVVEKPEITVKTKKHLPRKKTLEKIEAAKKADQKSKEEQEATKETGSEPKSEETDKPEPEKDNSASDEQKPKDEANTSKTEMIKEEQEATKETGSEPKSEETDKPEPEK